MFGPPTIRMASSIRSTPAPVTSAVSSGWLNDSFDEADGAQVVDLVGLDLLHGGDERGKIGEITVDQLDLGDLVLDDLRLRVVLPTDHAVDLVSLPDEQLSQVAAVLAGDAGDQSAWPSDLLEGAEPWPSRQLLQDRPAPRDDPRASQSPVSLAAGSLTTRLLVKGLLTRERAGVVAGVSDPGGAARSDSAMALIDHLALVAGRVGIDLLGPKWPGPSPRGPATTRPRGSTTQVAVGPHGHPPRRTCHDRPGRDLGQVR